MFTGIPPLGSLTPIAQPGSQTTSGMATPQGRPGSSPGTPSVGGSSGLATPNPLPQQVSRLTRLQAIQRQDAQRLRLQADDDMAATIWAQSKDAEAEGGEESGRKRLKTTQSISLKKVAAVNANFTALTRVANAKKAITYSTANLEADVAIIFSADGMEKEATEFKADVGVKATAANNYLDSIKQRLETFTAMIEECNTEGAVNAVKQQIHTVAITINQGDLRTFNAAMSSLGRAKAAAGRKNAASRRREAAASAVHQRVAPPLWTIMQVKGNNENASIGLSPSLFEAKAGHRPCVLNGGVVNGKDSQTLLSSLPFSKSCLKDCRKAIAKGVEFTFRDGGNAPGCKKLIREMRKFWDPQIFTTLPTPESEWALKLWMPQFFISSDRSIQTGMTHFAAMEARYLVEGSEYIWGVRLPSLAGSTLRDKKMAMISAMHEDLDNSLLGTDAFFVKHVPDTVVIIPTGFMVAVASIGESKGIRWSFSSDENDTQRVRMNLEALLRDFPELNASGKGYQNYLDFLEGRVG